MNKKYSALIASGIIFAVFTLFSYLVKIGAFAGADVRATTVLQNNIPRVFDGLFSVFSLLGSAEITSLALIASLYFLLKGKFREQILALFLFGFGTAVELVGKFLLLHPSPPYIFYRGVGFVFPSKYIHTNFSYPSGHMFRTAFIVILIVLLLNAKYKHTAWIVAIIILALMALSRVYLGEHWATDVVGGALLGGALSLLTAYVVKRAKAKN